jgi:hypothetical protein
MMTGREYRQSLKARGPLAVYMNGERLKNPTENPIAGASINSIHVSEVDAFVGCPSGRATGS